MLQYKIAQHKGRHDSPACAADICRMKHMCCQSASLRPSRKQNINNFHFQTQNLLLSFCCFCFAALSSGLTPRSLPRASARTREAAKQATNIRTNSCQQDRLHSLPAPLYLRFALWKKTWGGSSLDVGIVRRLDHCQKGSCKHHIPTAVPRNKSIK